MVGTRKHRIEELTLSFSNSNPHCGQLRGVGQMEWKDRSTHRQPIDLRRGLPSRTVRVIYLGRLRLAK